MDINEITIGQAREISAYFTQGGKSEKPDNGPWCIGKKYFIRTVSMHLTGELVSISPQEIVIKDAAWIADSGRFNEFVRNVEKAEEVEPFASPVIVGRGAIVDATEIPSLPIKVK